MCIRDRIRLEAIAIRLEAIAIGLEAIAIGLEAIANRLEAIASRLEAIASRLEAIASRLEAIASRLEVGWRPSLVGWRPLLGRRFALAQRPLSDAKLQRLQLGSSRQSKTHKPPRHVPPCHCKIQPCHDLMPRSANSNDMMHLCSKSNVANE